jgi:hypothetical protein
LAKDKIGGSKNKLMNYFKLPIMVMAAFLLAIIKLQIWRQDTKSENIQAINDNGA